MSALAAMFAPPRVRHVPTRLIVAGREVKARNDLPPLPDAQSRDAVKARITNIKHQEWYTENKDKKRAYNEKYWPQWFEENKEKRRAKDKEYREANPTKRSMYHRKWYAENREKILARVKANYERKRDAKRNQEKREHEPVAQTLPAPKAKGNGKPRTAAHAGRVEALASV